MAIQCRCPKCSEVILTGDDFERDPVRCHACDLVVERRDTLCVVCDAVNPWRHRDSVHLWCLGCGNTQTIFAQLKTA